MDDTNENMSPEMWQKMRGFGIIWRITLSVASALGWLAFLILWLAFYAGDYNFYQNIAIIIASIIGFCALNAVVWVPFGMRFADKGSHPKKDKAVDVVSMIAGIIWAIFLAIWLFQYAGDYNIYQNIAVFIVSILVLGVVSAAAHGLNYVYRHGRC